MNLNAASQTRRHFLKAAGVSIALPHLESFGAATHAAASPKRMVFVSTGLGMNPRSFFPKETGANFAPSPVLNPLGDHRGDFTVFSHMDHPNIFNKHGGIYSLLNGVNNGNAKPGENVTIDQVAASHLP